MKKESNARIKMNYAYFSNNPMFTWDFTKGDTGTLHHIDISLTNMHSSFISYITKNTVKFYFAHMLSYSTI